MKEKVWAKKDNLYKNVYSETTNRLLGIWRILCLWKTSVFRLIWRDFLIFFSVYFLLSILYRFALLRNERAREFFEMLCIYSSRFGSVIPLSFLMGFFVTQVVTRWWSQFQNIPWMDEVAFKVLAFIPGEDEFHRNLRKTVMRHLNLSNILTFRLISGKAQRLYPDLKSLVKEGLLTNEELIKLDRAERITPFEYTWAPIIWSIGLLKKAKASKKFDIAPPVWGNLISEINKIQDQNRNLLNYAWISFPPAYTQVVTVCVFLYFIGALFGRQFLKPPENLAIKHYPSTLDIFYSSSKPFDAHTPNFIIPIFTMVEYLLYVGWLKVAEALLNPFGEDDQDFDIDYIIQRNLRVSYAITDGEKDDENKSIDDLMLAHGVTEPKEPKEDGEEAETSFYNLMNSTPNSEEKSLTKHCNHPDTTLYLSMNENPNKTNQA